MRISFHNLTAFGDATKPAPYRLPVAPVEALVYPLVFGDPPTQAPHRLAEAVTRLTLTAVGDLDGPICHRLRPLGSISEACGCCGEQQRGAAEAKW
jgi:hypothetical protein